jgi:error-prone DNA polymerase
MHVQYQAPTRSCTASAISPSCGAASHPEELVDRARELDYSALAVTDECSLAGVVRAHLQARDSKFPLLIGAEFSALELLVDMPDAAGVAGIPEAPEAPQALESPEPLEAPGALDRTGDPVSGARCPPAASGATASHFSARLVTPRLVLLARNRNGYGNLSQLITTARRRAPKGSYRLLAEDLQSGLEDCLALWVPRHGETEEALLAQACWLRDRFGAEGWLAAELLTLGDDLAWLERLKLVERQSGVPLVAAGDVHFHVRSRKSLQDTLTAIQLNKPVGEAGFALAPNAEQHLRSRLRLSQIYPSRLLEETLEIASRCTFSLEELRYEYPEEIVPAGETPATWLKKLTMEGSRIRFPEGLPHRFRRRSRMNWN